MMQQGLLVILLVAIIDYVIGTFIPPSLDSQAKGFTGYSSENFLTNIGPGFRDGFGFFDVFAIFFPAATGIMAGANISGDLRDAEAAIPKGTFLAIFLTTIFYMGGVILSGSVCVRDASGSIADLVNGTGITACMGVSENGTEFNTCQYGLMNYMHMMEIQSAWSPLILAGIIAATISSALASLVSAPKVFQALCKDKLFPGIHVFGKGYGPSDEPRMAYLLTFLIAVGMILIGDLNTIAPLISNFFLASYGLINFAVFHAEYTDSPGWRPRFRYFNKWLSMFGAWLCVAVMFVISWVTALITVAVIVTLFIYILYSKPDANWGSSTQAHAYKTALSAIQKLNMTEEHVKNYRPQILALTGNPCARPSFVHFVANITKESSLLICGQIIQMESSDKLNSSLRNLKTQIGQWLAKRKVRGFYVPVVESSLRTGARALMQLSGMGKLRPNILMLGYKQDWPNASKKDVEDYVGIIHDAFDENMGVGVLRVPQGLDMSEEMKALQVDGSENLKMPLPSKSSANLIRDAAEDTNNVVKSNLSYYSLPIKEDGKPKERTLNGHRIGWDSEGTPVVIEEDEEEEETPEETPAETPTTQSHQDTANATPMEGSTNSLNRVGL